MVWRKTLIFLNEFLDIKSISSDEHLENMSNWLSVDKKWPKITFQQAMDVVNGKQISGKFVFKTINLIFAQVFNWIWTKIGNLIRLMIWIVKRNKDYVKLSMDQCTVVHLAPFVMFSVRIVHSWPNDLNRAFYAKQQGNVVECFDVYVPQIGELIGGSVREVKHNSFKSF